LAQLPPTFNCTQTFQVPQAVDHQTANERKRGPMRSQPTCTGRVREIRLAGEERLWQAVHDVHRDLAAVDILNLRIPATVRAPSAIWTYMIFDNPFGDAASRISLTRRRSR